MKKRIEKKEAKRNWNHPTKGVMLMANFNSFEEYWEHCKFFNELPEDEQIRFIRETTKFVKQVKTKNMARRTGIVLPKNILNN
ncbi:MAG: hypothetical protein KAT66_00580 [Candidatus Lokiarchaeota archaeon]|nr:hypothetical protein [Candidatus Lokiarchaeota archaeon]